MTENLSRAELFFVEFENAYIHGNAIGASEIRAPDILFLHGNMPSAEASDFFLLRQLLARKSGISSCAFDFIGHGNTGGDWAKSSLSGRTQQAADIVSACFDSQPFTIVAFGTGAYTAIKLTELFSINNLILVTPSVYATEVYSNCFGEEKVYDSISLPPDWEKTDAWSVIEQFKGGVSIVGASEDAGAFSGVISRLYSHSIRASGRQALEMVSGGNPSQLLKSSSENSSVVVRLAEIIKQAYGCLNPGISLV
jgi:pimeloyl-ACP methyl ester carboxylesterase